jgi:hypothetical protein
MSIPARSWRWTAGCDGENGQPSDVAETESKIYEFTFGGSSVGKSKRLSCLRLEKLSPRKSQKAITPRLTGMEIHNGKSSIKQTNMTPRPITAAKPADFSMTYLAYSRTALFEK